MAYLALLLRVLVPSREMNETQHHGNNVYDPWQNIAIYAVIQLLH